MNPDEAREGLVFGALMTLIVVAFLWAANSC